MSPTGSQWTDPFSALMQLGDKMIVTAMAALGAAGLLASSTGSAAITMWNVLSLDFPAAGATIIGHLLMQFLATPIFIGCMALRSLMSTCAILHGMLSRFMKSTRP